MAQYPLVFLKQLRSEMPDTDDIHKLGLLIKNSTDANYLLAGRFLKDMPLGELREFGQLIMTVATIAHELGMMIDGHIQAKERGYQGAPIQKENRVAMT